MNFVPQPSLYKRIGGKEGLHHFYADVRQHAVIGPIFNKQVKDWPTHLETIGSFWSQITGGPAGYAGGMPFKHLNLGIDASHFAAWLELWEFNCRRYLKENEAKEMIELAHGIGQRLKSIVATHNAVR
jgi:hemoglobin